ncbi:amidohydrolase family protein [Prosthecobacter sp.]|uniref:amidohydrolase family protein n=1 Tax=Prosthecobacter sp. TaxID=1965333 RepID=UPI002AB972F9|nr:amidohydrolase family protein [Prosthecobacter sp.]MDZ4401387.1 amidohydrolase family protein [Prosthecobacter sp.]
MNRRHFLTATVAGSTAVSSTAAAAVLSAGVIDCQSHLFFPEVLDMMRKRKVEPLIYDKDGTVFLKMGDWLRKVPPHYLDVEAKLAAMDASGIEITMLSTNDPGPEWFGDDGPAVAQLIHDSLAGVIAKHPTRFRGLCVLPLQNEKAAAEELDRCVKKLGFKGILLYTNLAGAWCDEPQFHWVYARAEELGVPILLHPAKPMTTEQVKGYELTSTLGNMFENTIAIARIIASGLLDKHPKLKLVCPHLGGTLPYICGRMDHQLTVLKRGPQNLQRKPSEYLRSIHMDIVSPLPEAMRFALDFSRADKLLFSSDHPWVQPQEILDPLRSLNLDAATEAKILSGNARQLFNL